MENDPHTPTSLDRPSLKDKVAEALGDAPAAAVDESEISVTEARRQKSLRTTVSNRTNIRILFVTSDRTVFEEGSKVQQHYADLAQFVGELHIMVLETKRGEVAVTRPMSNVWLYAIPGRHSWQHVWRARRTALSHLRFNGVTQPDIVVATDPFTTGVAAWLIGRALKRPWQLHLSTNYFALEWINQDKKRNRALRWARFVLKRAQSVRATSDAIATEAKKRVRNSEAVETLPRLFHLEAYTTPQPNTLHEQYHQHPLIALAEGRYQADSALHDVFAAVHTLLQRGQVALLIRGTGRAKRLFEDKAKLLGVQQHVIFESADTDPISRYQGADIFIEAATDSSGDERFLRAIASTTPVVAYRNDFRADIIVDGDSGFLCEPGDSYALGQHVRTLVNDSARRKQFAMRAKSVAEDQLHEDVPTYFMALRDTIAAGLTQGK